jgi:hypothetical protein
MEKFGLRFVGENRKLRFIVKKFIGIHSSDLYPFVRFVSTRYRFHVQNFERILVLRVSLARLTPPCFTFSFAPYNFEQSFYVS